jgi:hypothetical protein
MRADKPFTCSIRRIVEKCDIPSERRSPPGPFPGRSMFPHHWCAASCAATVKGALPVFSCRVRKPIPSENVMSVGNPCA